MFPPWLFRELLIQCLSSIISFYPLSRIKPKPRASSFCQAPSLQLPNTSQIHTRKFISFLLHMKIQIKMLFFITVSFQGFQLLLEILLLILFLYPPPKKKQLNSASNMPVQSKSPECLLGQLSPPPSWVDIHFGLSLHFYSLHLGWGCNLGKNKQDLHNQNVPASF